MSGKRVNVKRACELIKVMAKSYHGTTDKFYRNLRDQMNEEERSEQLKKLVDNVLARGGDEGNCSGNHKIYLIVTTSLMWHIRCFDENP